MHVLSRAFISDTNLAFPFKESSDSVSGQRKSWSDRADNNIRNSFFFFFFFEIMALPQSLRIICHALEYLQRNEYGAKSSLKDYTERIKIICTHEHLVEDRDEYRNSEGALEALYRFSCSDRSGKLVPLCNCIEIENVSVYVLAGQYVFVTVWIRISSSRIYMEEKVCRVDSNLEVYTFIKHDR